MVKRVIVFLIASSVLLCCRERGNSDVSVALEQETDLVAQDTNFIHRESRADFYNAIFIDTTKDSKFRKRLIDFEFDDDDKHSYQSTYQYSKKRNLGNFGGKHNVTGVLSSTWVPVQQYHEKYYLYAPSDWGNAGRRMVNDSAFVYWYMDGPYPVSLESFKQLDKHKYELSLLNVSGEKTYASKIIIHVVDDESQLSVFEFPEEADEYRYQLFVPSANADRFDMIVNYSTEKVSEFVFDKVDYIKLLKQ